MQSRCNTGLNTRKNGAWNTEYSSERLRDVPSTRFTDLSRDQHAHDFVPGSCVSFTNKRLKRDTANVNEATGQLL